MTNLVTANQVDMTGFRGGRGTFRQSTHGCFAIRCFEFEGSWACGGAEQEPTDIITARPGTSVRRGNIETRRILAQSSFHAKKFLSAPINFYPLSVSG